MPQALIHIGINIWELSDQWLYHYKLTRMIFVTKGPWFV